jgi:hypothetical protein
MWRGVQKLQKSLNVEVGINVEGGIFWKKLVHKCNKRGWRVENLRNQETWRGDFFCGGWNFSKSVSMTSRL